MPDLSEEAAFERFLMECSEREWSEVYGRELARQLDAGEAPELIQDFESEIRREMGEEDGDGD